MRRGNKRAAIWYCLLPIVLFLAGCDEEDSPFGGRRTFLKLFGTPGNDQGTQVIQGVDGGFVLIGTTNLGTQTGQGRASLLATGGFHVVKTDDRGDEFWAKTYFSGFPSAGSSIQVTDDGNYMALGTVSNGSEYADMVMLKLSPNGDSLWSKTYSFANQTESLEAGSQLRLTRDGGFILMGTTLTIPPNPTEENSSGTDMYVVRVDREGNRIWERAYGFDRNQDDYGLAALETLNGDFVWLGSAEITRGGGGPTNMRAVRSNNLGNLIWDFRFGLNSSSEGYDVQALSDGFVLVGKIRIGGDRIFLVKIDPNGQVVWQKDYQEGSSDAGLSVCVTQDGGFAIAGYATFSGTNRDLIILKTNAQGDKEWRQVYGGAGQDVGNSIIQAADGGFLVGGVIQMVDIRMMCMIKTDADGRISER